jgi:ligand-binding sensor domain-containing protein/two-component sensor histidine kinase
MNDGQIRNFEVIIRRSSFRVQEAFIATGRVAWWLGLLLAVPVSLRAEQLPIKTYTTADGLARDQINRIVRDAHGFLWFCTPEGLSRFDGYTFTNYTAAQGLPHRSVRDLLETRTGIYWIATGDGLCRFNPKGSRPLSSDSFRNPQSTIRNSSGPLFAAYHPGESEAARSITALYEDHTGTVWVGTWAGLFRLEEVGGQVKFSLVEMGMPSETGDDRMVEDILEDRRGALWVGTRGSGLYRRWPDGRVERYTTRQGLPANRIQALLEDRDGRFWIATNGGLCLLNTEFGTSDFISRTGNPAIRQSAIRNSVVARVYTTRDGLPSNWISSLFQSSDGRLWVGSDIGLTEFSPTAKEGDPKFRTYSIAHGLSDRAIEALAEDRDGNLWIGTEGGGAMKLARNGFTTYSQADGPGEGGVGSVFEDRTGTLCAITKDRSGKVFILRFDGKRFRAIRPDFPKRITYFGWGWNQIGLQDRAGKWWIATGQGLCRFPKVSRVEGLAHRHPTAVYTTRDGLIADDVFRLFEDSRGDIWISTISLIKAGPVRWDRASETFHRYSEADGLPPNIWVEAFCEDAAGNLWIGFSGGLARYRAGRFTVFKATDGLPAGTIRGLYLDHAGRLWIATDSGGVGRLDDPNADRPRFVTYTTAHGLSSNQTWCLTEDRGGRLYIGTGRGVDRLNPETGQIKHYTTADGLARGYPVAAFRDRQGALWFVTIQGLSRFIPEPDRPPSPPPIRISGLRIAGELYPLSELGETVVSTLTLGPNENQLQIDFSSLRFGLGESLRYQYKLEGADRDWNALTDQRTVNYAKLSPGTYRFVVRAVNADGTPSPTPATVTFTILPPVWQRWWFVMLAAMVVGFVAYFIYRVRVARLVEMERVRTRIATDLHDEIGSNLSLIAMIGEVANRHVPSDDSQMAVWLSLIASTSRETVDSMSDIVWAVNPQKDSLSDLTQRMRRVADDNFSARNITFHFSAPSRETDIKLGAETRREIFKIFKESVNNIVRHAECTHAAIELRIEAGWLVLKLSDNGQGFDVARASEGNGLASMRRRAKNLGGELEVISHPGSGTTVVLRAPLEGHRK